jgi:ribosome biogenesis GTPase
MRRALAEVRLVGRRGAKGPRRVEARAGRVVATAGRRVIVDAEGEQHVCFLSGRRAVIGDQVTWRAAQGGGGVLEAVQERTTTLRRMDHGGREQVLAANLRGLVVVLAAVEPPFHAPLLDRYAVAAGEGELDVVVCLTKCDLGVPDDVDKALSLRADVGTAIVRTSSRTGAGLDALREHLGGRGAWALVGPSGAGKTSLLAALAPDQDVGPTGAVSERDGMGRHTTTGSRLFRVGALELADSPGIRTFTPVIREARALRDHFPGLRGCPCRYRDCLHRPDEEGCAAAEQLSAPLLASYRDLLIEVAAVEQRRAP